MKTICVNSSPLVLPTGLQSREERSKQYFDTGIGTDTGFMEEVNIGDDDMYDRVCTTERFVSLNIRDFEVISSLSKHSWA